MDMALGLGVAFVWGLGLVFAKAAISHFPPILLMAFRFTVTAAALVWFVKPAINQMRTLFLISFISATLQYSLTFSGLAGLDASATALIIQLEIPFLVIIGALFLKETPGWRRWIGILIAFFGVYQITGEPDIGNALGSVMLVIGGGLAWAIGQAMVRKLKDIQGLTVASWVSVLAFPQLFIMSAIFETGQVHAVKTADWVVWGAVAYLGLIMTALGYYMWYTLIRRTPVSEAAPYLLTLPLFSILGGSFFLGETISEQTLIGGVIIVMGVALIILTPNTKNDALGLD
ncbi:MAG: DMT family transporter, partial [Planktomarina sp.]|nr:DMT family transporter [Planktomarina sp.]